MRDLFGILLAIVFILNLSAFAQPELDTTFRSTGKLVVNFVGAIGFTQDTVVQPDNKIIMVAPCFSINNGPNLFCAIRLNADGSLDSNFGSPVGINSVPGSTGGVGGVALQNDGKIVMVGSANASGGEQVVVMRRNPDGSPDSTFGSSGIIFTDVAPSRSDRARKVAIQPDGKIVVVGQSASGTSAGGAEQFAARYLTDGTLDGTFGSGGIATTNIPGHLTWGQSIVLQADGKILLGGYMATVPGAPIAESSYLLTRLNADGSRDNSWDGDGIRSIVFGSGGYWDFGILSLAVRPNGRVVALGHANTIYRFNSDGSLDLSFDGDGSRPALPVDLNDEAPSDMMVTAGGRITVVGHSRPGPSFGYQYAVARYRDDGSADTTFSTDGYLDIDVGASQNDGAKAVAADSLGRIVIAGISAMGTVNFPFENAQYSVARLIAPPTAAVEISGRVTRPDGRPVASAMLTIRNAGGETVGHAITNPFGYYRFMNVPSEQNYTVSVRSKGLTYADRSILLTDDIANFNFVGTQP